MPLTRPSLVSPFFPCRAKWGFPDVKTKKFIFDKSPVPKRTFFPEAQTGRNAGIAVCQHLVPFFVTGERKDTFRSFATLPQCEGSESLCAQNEIGECSKEQCKSSTVGSFDCREKMCNKSCLNSALLSPDLLSCCARSVNTVMPLSVSRLYIIGVN